VGILVNSKTILDEAGSGAEYIFDPLHRRTAQLFFERFTVTAIERWVLILSGLDCH